MSDLKQIISVEKIEYPEDKELWVELYKDVSMGVSEQFNTEDFSDIKNAYILLSNILHDWNFAGMDGKKLPVSVEGVKKLPSKIAEWILEESTKIISPDRDKKKDSQKK